MAYSKIIYNGNTLIDLTGDDFTAADLLAGKHGHGADGEAVTGTMTNRGAVSGTIATRDGAYTIPAGYHNGAGSVGISSVEKDKLIPGNIKNGVTILSVQGTYSGESANYQAKSVSYTPSATQQSATVTADSGYDALSSVTVTMAAIPYSEELNASGGYTATIG